jgi:leucyl aminopeptidase
MTHPLLSTETDVAHPIWLASEQSWEEVKRQLPAQAARFAEIQGFEPKPGRHCLLPNPDGSLLGVLFGVDGPSVKRADPFLVGKLPTLVPEGVYRLASPPVDASLATLSWLLGAYAFTRYGKKAKKPARLVPPESVDAAEIGAIAEAVAMGRDLVNTPANDLGPDGLEAAARRLAGKHAAAIEVVAGDDILKRNFPMIHAVGRASATPPRLIDMRWGAAGPRIAIIGKGVTFDTGGLNIKPDAAMLLMKKDMGGAAAALALADMVMGADLPIRLRVLVPAVENMISGASFRPGDVLQSRKGLTVEIGNTDAEGRLILADALALADEEEPELVVDFATLTGAARVALGPDLPPFYTEDDGLAADLARLAESVNDPAWRLPLWPPYAPLLDSKVADINHISGGPFAGSITAALFLRRFATAAKAHVHFDVYAWNPKAQPGRPEGGEVQGARLVYALLKERYSSAGLPVRS